MSIHTLRYISPPKAYRLTNSPVPHSEEIDSWRIFEEVKPHPRPDFERDSIYEYHVVMEKAVTSQRELADAAGSAGKLANEIERAWCYAAARPFRCSRRLQIQVCTGPESWSGNYQDVDLAIRHESGSPGITLKWDRRAWQEPPFLPLEQALRARIAYVKAAPVLQDLVDLHVDSFAHYGQPQLILLAKALEVVGAYYCRGTDRNRRAIRNAGLQNALVGWGVDSKLTQSVEWLFDIANTRKDLRHTWDDKLPGVTLHPHTTFKEENEFVHNADLVIRAFICERFALPLVHWVEN